MILELKIVLCLGLLFGIAYVLQIMLLDWFERRAKRNIRRIIKEYAEELANTPDEEQP